MIGVISKLFGSGQKWYDRIMYCSFLFIAFLAPLLFSFRLKSVFALPKIYGLSILLFVAISMLVVKYLHEKSLNLRTGKFNLLLILYSVALIISSLLSVNIYSSIFGTYIRFMGLLTLIALLVLAFLIFNFVKEKEDQISILIVSYVTSVIVVFLGILQHFGFIFDLSELNAVASRAFATLGHANHFGGYIVQSIFVSLAVFFILKNKILKWSILVLNVLFLFALFETSSRGAFLALAICSVVAFISICKLFWKKYKGQLIKIILALFLIFFISIIGIFVFKDKVVKLDIVKRSIDTIEFMKEGNIPDRLSWIFSGMQITMDRPIFGFGVSTFADVYNQYRRLDYRAPGDEQDLIVPNTAHNEYLNTAATQGLVGLALYLALIFYPIVRIYKIAFSEKLLKEDKRNSLILIFLACGILAYTVQVSVNFGTPGTMIPFVILLGIGLGFAENQADHGDSIINVKGYVLTAIIIFISIFAASNLYMQNNMVKADRFLRLTDVLDQHSDFKKEGYIYHIDAMTRAVTLNPFAYNLYEQLGTYDLKQALRVAEFTKTEDLLLDAVSAYRAALNLNDFHADTYKDLATIYSYFVEVYSQVNMTAKADDYKNKAIESYEHSIELSPNNPIHRMIAANKYMQFGHFKRALELFIEVKNMRPEYPEIDKKILEAQSKIQSI